MTRGAPLLEPAPPRWLESTISDDGAGLTTVALVLLDRPFNMNEARRMHVAVWSKNIAIWRDTFSLMAAQCPRLAWAELVVHHEVGRRIIPDYGACMPAAKAALDGCIDRVDRDGNTHRGLLPDDSWPFLRGLTFTRPMFTGRYALTLEFSGPLETEAPSPC